MKTLILIALLALTAFSAATNKSMSECAADVDMPSDTGCDEPSSSESISEACKGMAEDVPTDAEEEWSTEYGEDWHACYDEMIDTAGDLGCSDDFVTYLEDMKACDANILVIASLALVALLF